MFISTQDFQVLILVHGSAEDDYLFVVANSEHTKFWTELVILLSNLFLGLLPTLEAL